MGKLKDNDSSNIHDIRRPRSIPRTYIKDDLTVPAEYKYELLLSITSVFIWEYDIVNDVFSANRSLCLKLGIEHKPYSIGELKKELDFMKLDSFLTQLQAKQSSPHNVVHIVNRVKKIPMIFESSYKSICNSNHECVFLLGTMIDITERETLKLKASHDGLTQCFNRGSANISLESTYEHFCETGDMYTLIFFDIDKFKDINDTYGHDAGDLVLKQFCSRIQQEIRSNDKLFRWGGDEFLLICEGIAKENMYSYVERLRRIVETTDFIYGKKKLDVTTSIGAAYYYKSDIGYKNAMKRADRSLYKSKLAGRNNACMLLK